MQSSLFEYKTKCLIFWPCLTIYENAVMTYKKQLSMVTLWFTRIIALLVKAFIPKTIPYTICFIQCLIHINKSIILYKIIDFDVSQFNRLLESFWFPFSSIINQTLFHI